MNAPEEINDLYQLLTPGSLGHSTEGDDWQTMLDHLAKLVRRLANRNENLRKRVEELEDKVVQTGVWVESYHLRVDELERQVASILDPTRG